MGLLIKKMFLLLILTYLKIAIILANSLHSTFLCICKVVADILQLPTSHLLNSSPSSDNNSTRDISHCYSPKVSTFVQTDEESKQLENAGCKSSTDVIICNLNSTQKLVITQGKFKRNQCENCKLANEITTSEKVSDDGSNISYMSIESDVIDSKIETGCSSSSISSAESESLNTINDGFNTQLANTEVSDKTANAENDSSKRASFGNLDNTCSSSSDDKFNMSLDFEYLKENNPDHTYVKSDDAAANKQKTSSPLSQNPQSSGTGLNMFNADQSRITENKDARISTNLENWRNSAFGTSFKRRLSLPVKLNTSNTELVHFKQVQKQLIEDALKNTSRHEKSSKEIKYPFSSEISLNSQHDYETDDRGVFSCSSYESLPISDHIRNAFNNSTLLNLYNENLHSEDKPDFSCIDNLVEAFGEIKNNLSRPNLAQSKMSRYDIANEKRFESLDTNEISELKDHKEVTGNLKDTKLREKKNKETLNSEINLNSSVSDICNVLDRFVTSETKLVTEKFKTLIDEGGLINGKSTLNSDVNSGNSEQSMINDCERSSFSAKEYKSFDNSIRKHEYQEENNTGDPNLYEVEYTSSSPLKCVLPDLFEWSDIENTEEKSRNKLETNKLDSSDKMQKVWQQSYHKIAFIDDSPSDETSCANQNISEVSCQDLLPFKKDEKVTLFKVDLGVKPKKFVPCYNLLSAQQRWNESLGKSTDTDNNKPDEITCRPLNLNTDSVEWTSVCDNSVFSLKTKVEKNKAANHESFCQQQDQTKQNILETNCQEHQSTIFEENTSSEDSTSDNSVETVKDLYVVEV